MPDFEKMAHETLFRVMCASTTPTRVNAIMEAFQQVRNDALEQAAEVAENAIRFFEDPASDDGHGEEQWEIEEIAKEIRSLKSSTEGDSDAG